MGNLINKFKKNKRDLEEEIKILQAKNKELEKRIAYFEKLETITENQKIQLSKEMIQKYVNDFLEDEKVNIDYLPDFVERKIYVNTFNILINLINHLFENTKLSFLNHNITLNIEPIVL